MKKLIALISVFALYLSGVGLLFCCLSLSDGLFIVEWLACISIFLTSAIGYAFTREATPSGR